MKTPLPEEIAAALVDAVEMVNGFMDGAQMFTGQPVRLSQVVVGKLDNARSIAGYCKAQQIARMGPHGTTTIRRVPE